MLVHAVFAGRTHATWPSIRSARRGERAGLTQSVGVDAPGARTGIATSINADLPSLADDATGSIEAACAGRVRGLNAGAVGLAAPSADVVARRRPGIGGYALSDLAHLARSAGLAPGSPRSAERRRSPGLAVRLGVETAWTLAASVQMVRAALVRSGANGAGAAVDPARLVGRPGSYAVPRWVAATPAAPRGAARVVQAATRRTMLRCQARVVTSDATRRKGWACE